MRLLPLSTETITWPRLDFSYSDVAWTYKPYEDHAGIEIVRVEEVS